MKNIFKFAAVSAALLLGACSKDAPDIQGGTEDLKYVVSSNVLNSDKVSMELDYASPIVFVMADSLTQVTVTMEGGSSVSCTSGGSCTVAPSGSLVSIRVTQSGDSVIVTPTVGAWTKNAYSLSLAGSFKSGVAVAFEIGLTREPGLNLVSTNFFDVKNNIEYLEVPVSVGELTLEFDQDIDSVEQFKLTAGGKEVATTTAIEGNVLTATIGVDALEFNTTYVVAYTVRTEAGLKATATDVSGNFRFQTAVTTFLPVSSNVKVLRTAVGEETYDFPLQGTLEVTFSEKLDTNKFKLIWLPSTSTRSLANSKGNVSAFCANSNGDADCTDGGEVLTPAYESNVSFDGKTLKVVPVLPLRDISNGQTVGFKVVVQAARDVKLIDTVEVQAYLRNNQLYVVSANVLDSVGKYRRFKVTGDSLVVTFSKAVNPEGFKVTWTGSGVPSITNYNVSWDSTATVATIKNIDTLVAASYGDDDPYELGGSTEVYSGISFAAKTADSTQEATGLTTSGYALNIHPEEELALVNVNVINGHWDATQKVIPSEAYKAADSLNDSMNIVLAFNRVVDTTLIKKWVAKDASTAKFVYISDFYYNGTTWATKVIPAALSVSADGKVITLNPVEKLSVFSDKNQTAANMKDRYTVVFTAFAPGSSTYGVPAAGLKGSDGVSSMTLGSSATDVDRRYFTLPMPHMDVSASAYTPALAMKDTTIAGTKYVQDSLSVGLTKSAALSASKLKYRLTQPTVVKGVINEYQYRAQVRYKGLKTVSGWFYSTNTTAAKSLGMLDLLPADTAAKKSYVDSLDISELTGLMTWDKDGSGTAYKNDLVLFNNGDTIEVQVRGYHLNANDTSYTPWSTSLKYFDNVAPMNPVYQGTFNVVVANGKAGATALDRSSAATADSLVYIVTFPEDMDISTAPSYGFYPMGAANKPMLDQIRSKWTDARHYKMVFNLSTIDYSAITSLVFSVNTMKDAAGNEIKQETGSLGSLVTGAIAPTRGTLNIGYAATTPAFSMGGVSTPLFP